MKELVEVIAKALVDDPESVVVTEREDRKATVATDFMIFSLLLPVEAKVGSIRCQEAAAKEDKKVIVDILD